MNQLLRIKSLNKMSSNHSKTLRAFRFINSLYLMVFHMLISIIIRNTRFYTLIFSLLCPILMYSQINNENFHDFASLRSITPNAPTTASYLEYGSYPVNYVYGLPEIKIPLFDYGEGGLKQSIDIQYHADGIKVRERSGWVGLGWSLPVGGSITSTVEGFPDLSGYFENVSTIPSKQANISRLLRITSVEDSLL
mgnify:CR=1 FL=1